MNQFEHLSAESVESRFAQVEPQEDIALADVMSDRREVCDILRNDLGDSDAACLSWEVWVGNEVVHTSRDKLSACLWANENGYRINS